MEVAPILSVQNLSKKIKGKYLVQDVSFDVFENEVFGFLGANGAGKTTTIRMVVGLISPSAGDVKIGGASVSKEFENAMRHVGCIVENPEMYPFLTGFENLEQFGRMLGGLPAGRIEQVVEQVDLVKAIQDRVSTYSLGMRQRLGIAQALLGNPKLLILDEPTNGLDPAGIRELREFIKRLSQEEGLAVLISSHLLSEVQAMCDRVAIINQGRLLKVASVEELLSSEQGVIRMQLLPLEKAIGVLRAFPGVEVLGTDLVRITLKLGDATVSDLVKALVEEKIEVLAVESQVNTLEDLFLSLTGGTAL